MSSAIALRPVTFGNSSSLLLSNPNSLVSLLLFQCGFIPIVSLILFSKQKDNGPPLSLRLLGGAFGLIGIYKHHFRSSSSSNPLDFKFFNHFGYFGSGKRMVLYSSCYQAALSLGSQFGGME